MTPTVRIRHSATPAQHQFITAPERTVAFIAGIGSGKTRASVLKALSQPAGSIGMLVAPTYTMLKDTLLRTFLDIGKHAIRTFNAGDMHMRLINGTEVLFRSADNPERLRGPNLGWAGMDEAALMNSAALDIMLGRLRLDPGRLWFTTTPKGRHHWLYEMTRRSQNVRVIRARSMDNPYLPQAFLDELKLQYTADFYRQEVLGEFVEYGQTVFRTAARYETSELPRDGYREATGCDFAYTSRSGDWTVFLTGRLHEGIIYITDLYRKQTEATDWARHLKTLPDPFAFIGGQETGIVDFLRRDYGIRINTARAITDKLARVQPAAAAWNRGEIRLPADSEITLEIETEVLPFVGDPKQDNTDDIVDALSSLHEALLGRPEPFIPTGVLGWD